MIACPVCLKVPPHPEPPRTVTCPCRRLHVVPNRVDGGSPLWFVQMPLAGPGQHYLAARGLAVWFSRVGADGKGKAISINVDGPHDQNYEEVRYASEEDIVEEAMFRLTSELVLCS